MSRTRRRPAVPLATLAVRLTPRAARDEIVGVEPEPDGRDRRDGETVHVRVTAPPIEGRANAALVRLLARALRVPPTDVRLAAGTRGRRKRVEVTGLDAAEARQRLARASSPADDPRDGG